LGIRLEIAQSLVGLDIDLSAMFSYSLLATAIQALRLQNPMAMRTALRHRLSRGA